MVPGPHLTLLLLPGITAATRRLVQSTHSSTPGGRVGQRQGAGGEGGEGVGGGAVSGQPGALWQTEGRWWQQLSPQRRPGPPQLPPAARGGAGAAHIRPGRGGAASPSCSSQDTLEPGPGTHPALLPSTTTTTTSPDTKVVM